MVTMSESPRRSELLSRTRVGTQPEQPCRIHRRSTLPIRGIGSPWMEIAQICPVPIASRCVQGGMSLGLSANTRASMHGGLSTVSQHTEGALS